MEPACHRAWECRVVLEVLDRDSPAPLIPIGLNFIAGMLEYLAAHLLVQD